MPRFRRLFRFPWRTPQEIDREVDAEVQFHLEMRTQELIDQGMTPEAARADARRQFGNLEDTRRYCRALDQQTERQARWRLWLDELQHNLRYGARTLRKAPGFAAVTILTLALGIGATTAIFAVVNGVLLKPLPFEDQDELVSFWTPDGPFLSTARYFTFRDGHRVFEDVGSYVPYPNMSVTGLAEPEQVQTTGVTASFLPLLRVQPIIGRPFTAEDDSPGAPQTILLSHGYWLRRFGADPTVTGTTLRVNGIQREIIGVLPPALTLLRREAAIYYPLQLNRAESARGSNYRVVARLFPGATIEHASADVERMIPMVAEQFPDLFTPASPQLGGVSLRPLKQDYIGTIGSVLWVLLGAVGIVLLMACANVANLFLVRSEGRQREVAVRTLVSSLKEGDPRPDRPSAPA